MIVPPVPVDVLYFDRHVPRDRIFLRPSASCTRFAEAANKVSSEKPCEIRGAVQAGLEDFDSTLEVVLLHACRGAVLRRADLYRVPATIQTPSAKLLRIHALMLWFLCAIRMAVAAKKMQDFFSATSALETGGTRAKVLR